MSPGSSQLVMYAPLLLLAMAAEYAVSKRAGVQAYRNVNDTLSNLSCSVGQQLIELFLNVFVLLGYVAFQKAIGVKLIAPSVGSFVALFVLIDLVYYAYHRLSHHVPLLWAVHQVHHQSEEFNFSVGLRLPWFYRIVSLPIYLPAAILGFPPEMYVTVAAFSAVYQTWNHTKLFESPMRAVSWLIVVPYTHRVHHGADGPCVNKNFGGIFSIWDRIFGTHYEAEREPVYGIASGPSTWDPWKLNAAPVRELFARVKRARGLRERLRILFLPGKPDVRDVELGFPDTRRPLERLLVYSTVLLPAVVFFALAYRLSPLPRVLGALAFLIAFSLFGRALDRENQAESAEKAEILNPVNC